MFRKLNSAIALTVLSAAAPALAADYPVLPDLRSSYPTSWESSPENPLRFETGLRYWYSRGGQDIAIPGAELSTEDTSHLLELHGKIEDFSTQTYVKAQGGLSIATTGDYDFNGTSSSIGGDSTIGYAGGDFGWLPFGQMKGGVAIGGLVGYQYWKDSPDVGRGNFITGVNADGTVSGGDSAPYNLDIHALRLGVKASADLNDTIDIQAEVAAVPYAYVTGTFGPDEFVSFGPNSTTYKSSTTDLSGHGYGAMGELMVGFHPTENLTIRVGGRAWYLENALEATYDTTTVTDTDNDASTDPDVTNQRFITDTDYASLFRYGAMLEITGRF